MPTVEQLKSLAFPGQVQNPDRKAFDKKLLSLTGSRRITEVFDIFCCLSACCLSAGQREQEYMDRVKHMKKEELMGYCEAFAMLVDAYEAEPFTDILGHFHMEYGSDRAKQAGGEFYTPEEVCDLMARLTYGDEMGKRKEANTITTIMEPAVGSGRMILSLAKMFHPRVTLMRVHATDISKLAANMAYINFSLNFIPAVVHHGNALSNECWGSWKTLAAIMHPWGWPGRGGVNATHPVVEKSAPVEATPVPPEVAQPVEQIVPELRRKFPAPSKSHAQPAQLTFF